LTVTGINGDTGKAAATAPIPSGSQTNLVSDFEGGKITAAYGMWIPANDSMNGGKSTSKLDLIEEGAAGTKHAMQVTGELLPGAPFIFGGALFFPGKAPMEPANLSNKSSISFWAKGDGGTYTLMVLTEQRNGQNGVPPAMTTFVAGPEWKQFTFLFSTFETDGSDISGLGFIRMQDQGRFQFQLDELKIK